MTEDVIVLKALLIVIQRKITESMQRRRAIHSSGLESEYVSTMDHNVQFSLLFEVLALILETTKLLDQIRIAVERLDKQLGGKKTFMRQMRINLFQSAQRDSTVHNLLATACIEPDAMTIE